MTNVLDILAIQWATDTWPDMWDVLISIGMLISVSLLVITIFGQKGEVHLSPQREAAIATGHTDRRTVFENTLLRPFLWILLAVSHRLNSSRVKNWLRRQLTAAGSPNFYTPEEYLARSMLVGLGRGSLLEICYLLLTGGFSFTIVIVGLVVGIGISIYQITESAGKRLRSITKQLPYALDLISLAMGAGATFTDAVKTIIRDNQTDPLNMELKALLAEIELGTTRRQALDNLATRVPLTAVRSIVASIMQAEELGTPLATVLHDQSQLLRMQRSVRAENKAAVASVRILVPCLLLVMAVILTVFGPSIVRTVQGGLF